MFFFFFLRRVMLNARNHLTFSHHFGVIKEHGADLTRCSYGFPWLYVRIRTPLRYANLTSSHFSRRGQGNLYLRAIHSQVAISTFHYLSWFLRIFPLDFACHGITPSSVIMRMGIRADVQATPLHGVAFLRVYVFSALLVSSSFNSSKYLSRYAITKRIGKVVLRVLSQ